MDKSKVIEYISSKPTQGYISLIPFYEGYLNEKCLYDYKPQDLISILKNDPIIIDIQSISAIKSETDIHDTSDFTCLVSMFYNNIRTNKPEKTDIQKISDISNKPLKAFEAIELRRFITAASLLGLNLADIPLDVLGTLRDCLSIEQDKERIKIIYFALVHTSYEHRKAHKRSPWKYWKASAEKKYYESFITPAKSEAFFRDLDLVLSLTDQTLEHIADVLTKKPYIEVERLVETFGIPLKESSAHKRLDELAHIISALKGVTEEFLKTFNLKRADSFDEMAKKLKQKKNL